MRLLTLRLVSASLRSQMEDRASFLVGIASTFVLNGVEFLGIAALFASFGGIAGWTLPEIGLLYGAANLAFSMADVTSRGFDVFADTLRSGGFDRVLLRPRAAALQIAFNSGPPPDPKDGEPITGIAMGGVLARPNAKFPGNVYATISLGTDDNGNDILARILVGGRTSLFVALTVNLLGLVIGGGLGALAAQAGGIVDSIIMRLFDVLIAIPSLALIVAVSLSLGPGAPFDPPRTVLKWLWSSANVDESPPWPSAPPLPP